MHETRSGASALVGLRAAQEPTALNLDADGFCAGEQVHECCRSSGTGADVDEDVGRTHSRLLHHPEQGSTDKGRRGRSLVEFRALVREMVETRARGRARHIPLGGRDVHQSRTERLGVVLFVLDLQRTQSARFPPGPWR